MTCAGGEVKETVLTSRALIDATAALLRVIVPGLISTAGRTPVAAPAVVPIPTAIVAVKENRYDAVGSSNVVAVAAVAAAVAFRVCTGAPEMTDQVLSASRWARWYVIV